MLVDRKRIAYHKPRRATLAIFQILQVTAVQGSRDPAGNRRLVEP
jgi:hypothetical protein